MSGEDQSSPKVLQIYLEISQYPILSHTIRERMREELFARGIISRENFENEVFRKAIHSQRREGLIDPLYEEPAQDWEKRVRYIRAHLTDFYFAYNLPHSLFERIVQRGACNNRVPDHDAPRCSFNPEIARWTCCSPRGSASSACRGEERARVQHHLREIIVVLIKAMISDHLGFRRAGQRSLHHHRSEDDPRAAYRARQDRRQGGGHAAGLEAAAAGRGRRRASIRRLITIPDSYLHRRGCVLRRPRTQRLLPIYEPEIQNAGGDHRGLPDIHDRYQHAAAARIYDRTTARAAGRDRAQRR